MPLKKHALATTVLVTGLLAVLRVQAATDWSEQNYDLLPGDFNADGKTDLLYVAKDSSRASGIALSDGSAPNVPWQSWSGNYLGIPWSAGLYKAVVADFSGDGRADILMQRKTAGDSYLLLASEDGKITAVSQTIASNFLGFGWTADQHTLVAGDFDGNGRTDLFLQAMSRDGINAVVLADANGQFSSGPAQGWADTEFGFKWSFKTALIYAGDFNGDGRDDLLVQAKPAYALVDYDIPIPVPTYTPGSYGVMLAGNGLELFEHYGVQQWDRKAFGVDWSPLARNIVVADFDGNGTSDILLQARNGGAGWLVQGYTSGAVFVTGNALPGDVNWNGSNYRLIAGNFDGSSGSGIYFQATKPGLDNLLTNNVGAGAGSIVTHDPSASTGVVAPTAAGHTPGSFAVTATGAATYSIPIVVPKGIAGVQPNLSLSYVSATENGLLGVGWGLSGFSEISRCPKTLAQDGVVAGVSRTIADAYCLDGNRLRLTSAAGSYGLANSTYQTELEQFSRITALGSTGNGPASFRVEGKDGLYYEYGSTADSRVEVAGVSTVRTWALNKVSDRSGNAMSIVYVDDTANGSYRPLQINYTSNAYVSAGYGVRFIWEDRPSSDFAVSYFADSPIVEGKRLNRIETLYNDAGGFRVVHRYQLSYNNSGSTRRSRLASVQQCDADSACLSPTAIAWREGSTGWASTDAAVVSGLGTNEPLMQYARSIDVNADGRDDLVYPFRPGSRTFPSTAVIEWAYRLALPSGGYGPLLGTAVEATATTAAYALPIDYSSDGRMSLLINLTTAGNNRVLQWNGTALVSVATNIAVTLSGRETVGDFDGDGRQDLLTGVISSGQVTLNVRRNVGGSFAGPTPFYSEALPISGAVGSFSGPNAPYPQYGSEQIADFNGDGRADVLMPTSNRECSNFEGGEICFDSSTLKVLLSNGTALTPFEVFECGGVLAAPCAQALTVSDVNGDGYSDISYMSDSWHIRFGSLAGLSAETNVAPSTSTGRALAVDYDSDGRSDVMYVSGGLWHVMRFNGAVYELPVNLGISASNADTMRALDMNGDGQQDLAFTTNGQHRVRLHKGVVPDLVTGIVDGFGNDVSISYAPLTDASVHTKSSGAVFPSIDIQAPMYVVSSYTQTDGAGGIAALSQKYAGARVHVQGRGFEGFASRSETDMRTGMTSKWSFRQGYPFTGMVSEATLSAQGDGSGLISYTTNTLQALTTSSQQYNERVLPYTYESATQEYEVGGALNGTWIRKVTNTTTLDAFGNPTQVVVKTQDPIAGQSFRTETNATIVNSTAFWCLGRPESVTVKNTLPNNTVSAQPSTSAFSIKHVLGSLGC